MEIYDERAEYIKIVGANIEAIRSERGMTQAELREKTDISKTAYESYAHGRHEPTVYNIYKICKILGCSTDDVLDPDA